MKTCAPHHSSKAMTLLEVLVVILVTGVLAALLLPTFNRPRVRASRINCVSNIKQVGLAFRMWANDHDGAYPWHVSVATNGTLEFAESSEVFRHFLAVSNELNSPKVLACPTDTKRSKAVEWSKLRNTHLSYFAGLDASESKPQTILSGDRNITGGVVASNGIMRLDSKSPAGWGNDLHNGVGNLGLGDGSAALATTNSLRKQVEAALSVTGQPVRLAIPR